MCFLAQEAQLDDETAFQLADLENRARKDVSDLERARNYADALNRYYDGHLRGMAQRLKVSPSWLSKTIKIAAIPDEIVAAFGDPRNLQTKPGYALAKALEEEEEAERIRTRAASLAAEQLGRRERGERGLAPARVMRFLLRDAEPSSITREAHSWRGSSGRRIMSIQAKDKDGLLLRLHAGSGAGMEELVAAFREAIAGFNGSIRQSRNSEVFPRGNTRGRPAATGRSNQWRSSVARPAGVSEGLGDEQMSLL
jgi:ParB family chromosome partitioning protein